MVRSRIAMMVGTLLFAACPPFFAIADEITLTVDDSQQTIQGRILVEAQDGGVLFRENDGQLRVLYAGDYTGLKRDEASDKPLSHSDLASRLLSELPEGFEIHQTDHYVIAYNTSQAYAKWIGVLYERLYRGFRNFWKTRRFPLTDPAFPMPVIVFNSRERYVQYAQQDFGQDPGSMCAYYNLMTNRVAMYDLTGVDSAGNVRNLSSTDQVNAVLSRPAALAMVATIVHEATHQVMFNCGMQQRLADTPLWINEGLAVYFETPDIKSRSGWRGMGKVNRPRLFAFRSALASRPADSLRTLIADDTRFRDPSLAQAAYAEAWALNYFLLKRKPRDFVRYLTVLSEKKPLQTDEPEERIELFEKHFGKLQEIDQELVEFIRDLDG